MLQRLFGKRLRSTSLLLLATTFHNMPVPFSQKGCNLSFSGVAEASKQPLAFVPTSQSRRSSTQLRATPKEQHLVLVGGGHAHIQVIKALNAQARPEHLRVTLIDVQKSASYSGMVPACVSGMYSPSQTLLDLEPLARWSEIDFVNDYVVDINLDEKLVYLRDKVQPISFDAISLDIGSNSRNLQTTPGAKEYAIATRPIAKLIERLDHALQEEQEQQQNTNTKSHPRLVVIGGGAAGIELSMAVSTRWKDVLDHDDQEFSCTLLDAGQQLLPQESDDSRQRLLSILHEKNIDIRHGCQVQEITADQVKLDDGTGISYTHCIWATGAGPHSLARKLQKERGLDATEHGWFTVEPTLQSTSHEFVFAAGDCAHICNLESGSPPKAGVFAVRAGPILIENLTRYLQNQLEEEEKADLVLYQPQDDFLKLLVCGDGKALGFRFGMALYGKWVFDMKDCIDQNFMQLFSVDNLPDKTLIERGNYDTSQYDAQSKSGTDLSPKEAAELLQRTDDDVDLKEAWSVLRAMGKDKNLRDRILEHVQSSSLAVAR